jgi:hypothetical protein
MANLHFRLKYSEPVEVKKRKVKQLTMTFEQVKRQEAENRMAAIRRARRSPAAAAAEQRRASLVGEGAKWKITNFAEVARAIGKAKYKYK